MSVYACITAHVSTWLDSLLPAGYLRCDNNDHFYFPHSLRHIRAYCRTVAVTAVAMCYTCCRRCVLSADVSELKPVSGKDARAVYLSEKYAARWRSRIWYRVRHVTPSADNTWLHLAMFSASSRNTRRTACSVADSMFQVASNQREVIDMFTRFVTVNILAFPFGDAWCCSGLVERLSGIFT